LVDGRRDGDATANHGSSGRAYSRDVTHPPLPPRSLAAPGYQVRRLYQAYLAAWVRKVDSTLTGPQFAVLTAINATPGTDQRSLASMVALDSSTMTDVARRVEDQGLIVRRTAASDGRRKLLYLTDRARRCSPRPNRRARQLDEGFWSRTRRSSAKK
jgi:DNA-binding MarR family transcriptional regulator